MTGDKAYLSFKMYTKITIYEYYSNVIIYWGDGNMSSRLKYKYTTGPISVSENIDNIRVLLLNNGSKEHFAKVKILNLDQTPKTQVFSELFTICPDSETKTEFIPSFNAFEVQVLTDSPHVYIWVGGRSGNENLVGNTVLHKELISF